MTYTVDEQREILRSSGINPILAELVPDVTNLIERSNLINADMDEIERIIDSISNKYVEFKEIRTILSPALYQYLVVRGKYPIRIVGLGPAGVGKTEIIKQIFSKFNPKVADVFDKDAFYTNAVEDGTTKLRNYDFTYEGTKIRFTDVAGFGGKTVLTGEAFRMCKPIIEKADMIYYVFGSGRVWGKDQEYIEMAFKDLSQKNIKKMLLILNKIDLTEVKPPELPWDPNSNSPTPECSNVISQKIEKILTPIAKSFKIDKENIVECSAAWGYNLDNVFLKLVELGSDNAKLTLMSSMENVSKITSLVNAKDEQSKKIIKMSEDEIREELKIKNIDKTYKKLLETRLQEINRKERFKSFIRTVTLISPLESIKDFITPSNPFKEKTDGYKLQKQIYKDLYNLLKLDIKGTKIENIV